MLGSRVVGNYGKGSKVLCDYLWYDHVGPDMAVALTWNLRQDDINVLDASLFFSREFLVWGWNYMTDY